MPGDGMPDTAAEQGSNDDNWEDAVSDGAGVGDPPRHYAAQAVS